MSDAERDMLGGIERLQDLINKYAEPIGDLSFMAKRVEKEGVLLKGQREYIEKSQSERFVIAEKSRRVGLTWAQASDDVLVASTAKPFGRDVNYVGTSMDMAREYIEACADWSLAYNKVCGEVDEYIFTDTATPGSLEEDKHIKAFRIDYGSGNKIIALSSRPRSFRGRSGRAVLDEMAFQDEPEEMLKAVGAFLIRGGDIRIISTHNGVDSYYNHLINEVRSGKRRGLVYRYDFEDAVRDGLYESLQWAEGVEPTRQGKIEWLEDIFGIYKDNVDEELFCIPSISGGTYISLALIEACAHDAPVVRWKKDDDFMFLPKDRRERECHAWCEENLGPLLLRLDRRREHCFGSDFARSSDLSVMVPMEIAIDTTRNVPFTVELKNIPHDQQKQICFYILHRLPRFRKGAMDATGNGEYLAEAAQQEFGAARITAVRFSVEFYREHMPAFKSAFQDRSIKVPKDADTQADIHMFKVIDGVARMPKTRKGGKTGDMRHGDAGIAVFLSHWASRQDAVVIEFEKAHERLGAPHDVKELDIGFGVVGRLEPYGDY